uniref:Small ribosomal subunit protein uS7 domain-containing protein n=1 Tax=Chlamydomonas leiostraca TaxID=1034604 RepID=A0A7S0S0Z5_9CHLO
MSLRLAFSRRQCLSQPSLRSLFSTDIGTDSKPEIRPESNQGTSTSGTSRIIDGGQSKPQQTLSPSAQRLLDVFHQAGDQAAVGDSAPGVSQAPSTDRDQTPIPSQYTPDRNALTLVLTAVENCKPLMKVMQHKQGTRVVYVPHTVAIAEQRSLAVRWILEAARKRQDSNPAGKRASMAECLAIELMLAARKKGSAREKRDALHTLAIENKANLLRGSG